MAGFRMRDDCRLCGAGDLRPLLELAPTPPANELLEDAEASLSQERFPLSLWECPGCGHVQLPVVVDPERLFRNYLYVSGTSPSFVDHFRRYADDCVRDLFMERGHLVVDVGSNDGTLLSFFKGAGMRVLGVDPAKGVASLASRAGVDTVPEFLTRELAEHVVRVRGRASLVTANNVFAHADDLRSLAEAVRSMLHPFGVFAFEVQYLADMCEKGLFDMVYHEHLSYHHVGPLIPFLESAGLRLFDVRRVPTHGGSIRCFADLGRRAVSPRVDELRRSERSRNFLVPDWPEPGRKGPHPVMEMGAGIDELRRALTGKLREVREAGGTVAGYGAPAKATTLVHHFGLQDGVLKYVVDDNPLKQGRHVPGTSIPVVGGDRLRTDPTDYLLVLAWNFADPIVEKCAPFRDAGGRIIVPLPEMREVR